MLRGARKTRFGYRYEPLFPVCTKCGIAKCPEEFPFKNTEKGIRHRVCNECSNQRSNEYYRNNQEKHIGSVNRCRGEYLADHARYVWDYLSENPCVDCGETNPVLLEFDHRNADEKFDGLAQMVTRGYSLERIQAEIAKCDVRCANCHRRKTAEERGWFRSYWNSSNSHSGQRVRNFVMDYLSSHPCVDCGESDPVVLEFDHRGNKDKTVAEMVANGYSIDRILAEIEKCDVRCANCHRIKTANERGYFKWLER